MGRSEMRAKASNRAPENADEHFPLSRTTNNQQIVRRYIPPTRSKKKNFHSRSFFFIIIHITHII